MRKIRLRTPGSPPPTTEEEIERQAASDEQSRLFDELSQLIDIEGDNFLSSIDWTRVLFMAAGIHMKEGHATHEVIGGLCGPCVLAALQAGEEAHGDGYEEAMIYRSVYGNHSVEVLGLSEDEGLPPGVYGGPNS